MTAAVGNESRAQLRRWKLKGIKVQRDECRDRSIELCKSMHKRPQPSLRGVGKGQSGSASWKKRAGHLQDREGVREESSVIVRGDSDLVQQESRGVGCLGYESERGTQRTALG